MRISLSVKISLGVIVAVLLIIAVFLSNAYNYLISEEKMNLRQDTHRSFSSLQQTLKFLIEKGETEEIQAELSELGANKHIEYAVLIDEQNNIIASSQLGLIGGNVKSLLQSIEAERDSILISKIQATKSELGSSLIESTDSAQLYAIYSVAMGLEQSDNKIRNRTGVILAKIDLLWIQSDVKYTLEKKIMPMIVTLGVMVALFAIFLNLFLVRRIININRAADQLILSGYKSRASVDGDDELSDLARSFNTMAETVAEKNMELIKKEENISLIINYMENGVITIDDAGIVKSFNKSAEKMFGFPGEEIIGKNVDLLMPEPVGSHHDQYIKNYIKTGVKHIIGMGRDVTARHKDGTEFSIHLSMNEFPELVDGRRLFIGSCLDITQLKDQEQQLRQSQKMEALGKLTGGIAHDYNNMLGVILGYSELLMEKMSDDPRLMKYIKEIHNAGERGAKLTKKLLAFSRNKAAESEAIDINKVIKSNINLLEKTLTARIQLVQNLAENLWAVYLDRNDLEDAVLNMCINSMHAIKQSGKITLATDNKKLSAEQAKELKISTGAGDYVKLSICDSGIGISQEALSRLFDPFFSTKGEKGTGLGLSQVYGFVKRSNGVIQVDSEIKSGTCFNLYFPRYGNTPEMKEKQVANLNESVSANGETILIVDDEPSLRLLMDEILRINGYHVLLAESGKQALDILQKQTVDLMISDVIMPEMDGYQLSHQVMEKYPNIKIQLVSGYSDNRHISNKHHELHDTLLSKPVDTPKLLSRIRDIFEESVIDGSWKADWINTISSGVTEIDYKYLMLHELFDQCGSLLNDNSAIEDVDVVVEKIISQADDIFNMQEAVLIACGYADLNAYRSMYEHGLQSARMSYNKFKNTKLNSKDLFSILSDWIRNNLIYIGESIRLKYASSKSNEIRVALAAFIQVQSNSSE